jgi:uncharacterized membrane protein YoaK (UPF0700 family)
MFKPQPKWIVIGGCLLAFLSAAVNAGFLIRLGTSVSHLTGDVSKVAVDGVRGNREMATEAARLAIAAVCFVGGAVVAGYFIHHPGLDFDRPYGRSVSAIGFCLLGAHFTIEGIPLLAVGLAGFAFGLQNALATHYRGMILRTTHLTGLLTDFGVNLGMRLKGHEIPIWKLIVPGALILSFFMGSAFGALIVLRWDLPFALLISIAYLLGGLGWTVFKHGVMKPRVAGKS